MPPGRVEIVALDGRRWTGEGLNVPGNSENPLGWDALADKFRDCASVAARPLSPKRVETALALARGLDELPDATVLIRAMGD